MKVILLLSLLMPVVASAQSCFGKVLLPSTPTEQFTINDDGTILDNKTGIMWTRCGYGQVWDNSSSMCTGSHQQIPWQQALVAAANYQYANYDDWQLPNVKELATVVERQCVDPAVNIELFPTSLAENYWTSTSSIDLPDHAWAVAFYSGKNNLKSKLADLHLRLMRYHN